MKIVTSIDPNIRSAGKLLDVVDMPIVITLGDVTEEAAKEFDKQVSAAHNTGQAVIPVIVDSYGGSVYALMSILGTMEQSILPIATIVTGKAMSAGAAVAACGTPGFRYMDPNATFMIHEVSSYSEGSKITDLKNDANEAERLNRLMFLKIAANCSKTDNYFTDLIRGNNNADLYMMYDEALKHNLIDHLGIPSFVVNISKTIEFIQPNIEYIETTASTKKRSINKKVENKKVVKKGKRGRKR